ncbi:MAG: hypothetical protein ACLP5H_33580 [Desulfomonilaceae bacterium]
MGTGLSLIHQAGFSYGYVQIMDLTTGKQSWQVDAIKGKGPRMVGELPTLPETVKELKRLTQPKIFLDSNTAANPARFERLWR